MNSHKFIKYMNFDEKIELVPDLSLEKRMYAPENPTVIREINTKYPDAIYASIELYKYNKFGFRKKRMIYLTSNMLISADSKSIHNIHPYTEIKAIIEHPESLQLVIIDDKNKSYLFYFWNYYVEFCHILQILIKAKNKTIKIYTFSDLKTKIQDIFYAKSAIASLNSLISQHGVKNKKFPKDIKFYINFETFIAEQIKQGVILYRHENWHIVPENYSIKRVIKCDENWTVLQIYNSILDHEYVVKVAKKWNLTNNATNDQLTYKDIFENFSQIEGLVDVLLIFETKCFLFIFVKWFPYGNLYNYIYPGTDKNLFNETTLKPLVKQLLLIIGRVHQKGKVLLSLFPEDIYFTSKTTIAVSHITANKLSLVNKTNGKLVMNCEYTPPEVLSNKTIGLGLDFWCLGILIYECLFGVTPFQQNSDKDTENMIIYSDVFFPPDDYKHISDNAKSFITMLLTKDENKRNEYSVKDLLAIDWLKDVFDGKELIDETYQKVFETMVKDRKINTLNDGFFDTIAME